MQQVVDKTRHRLAEYFDRACSLAELLELKLNDQDEDLKRFLETTLVASNDPTLWAAFQRVEHSIRDTRGETIENVLSMADRVLPVSYGKQQVYVHAGNEMTPVRMHLIRSPRWRAFLSLAGVEVTKALFASLSTVVFELLQYENGDFNYAQISGISYAETVRRKEKRTTGTSTEPVVMAGWIRYSNSDSFHPFACENRDEEAFSEQLCSKALAIMFPTLLNFKSPSEEVDFNKILTCNSLFEHVKHKNKAKKRLLLVKDHIAVLVKAHCKYKAAFVYNKILSNMLRGKLQDASFVDRSISKDIVVRFMRCVLQKVIPQKLWGSARNRETFFRTLAVYFHRGNQNIPLSQFMQGFRESDCSWTGLGKCTSKDEHAIRHMMIKDFIFWVIKGYAVPLVRSMFRVMPLSGHTYFFLHSDWIRACKDYRDMSMSARYENVDDKGFEKDDVVSKLLLIPKKDTMRPVANMKRNARSETWRKYDFTSVNMKLKPEALPVLSRLLSKTSEFKVQSDGEDPRLGFSVENDRCAHRVLSAFQQRAQGKRIYMMKADVHECYDCLNLDILMTILVDALGESDGKNSDLVVQNIESILYPMMNRYRKKRVAVENETLEEICRPLNMHQTHKPRITVPSGKGHVISREKILSLVEKYICNNLVTLDGRVYRQRVGIPQGCSISLMLCNLYLAHFENDKFGYVRNSDESTLLRFVDDYLLLTTKRSVAERFYEDVLRGDPHGYGIRFSVKKTMANFSIGDVPVSDRIPWYGMLVDERLHVSRNAVEDAERTLWNVYDAPSVSVRSIIQSVLQSWPHEMDVDYLMNGTRDASRNMYDASFVLAMRMIRYFGDYEKVHSMEELPRSFAWSKL